MLAAVALRRAVVAVALVCSVAALCAACKGPGSSAPSDVFRVGLEAPRSLDPAAASLPAELLVATQLFDSLTSYDPVTLTVRPSLASSWTATPDQRHWDFPLRPDARFSNGRTITADDVKYSIERAVRPGSGSTSASQLEMVTGYKPFTTDPKVTSLAGIVVGSPTDVHVDLDEPFAELPAVLGNPSFGIVPREAVEASSPRFADEPVGSGPYRLASRTDTVLHLVPSPGGGAHVKVDIVLEDDVVASYNAFTRGKLDWTAVPADRRDEAGQRYGRAGFKPYVVEVLYGLNLKNAKFGDPRFREAISRAVDRQAIASAVYGGSVRPLSALVPVGIPGAQDNPCGERCDHDVDAAKALVAAAFAGRTVPTVEIDYDTSTTQDAVAKAIQANLAAAGIPSDVRPHDYADFLRFATSGQEELFHFASTGGYPSPDAFLTPLFTTGAPDNVTGYTDPNVDKLLQAARAEPDPARRASLYQSAEQTILAAVPVIPIAQYEIQSVAATRVKGLVLSPLGTFDASTVRL
jgi:ABC-type transport system substrate-binding protein